MSARSTPRQTRSFLMQRLREAGIQPNRRHGQNFLIDLNLVQLIVRAAELEPRDVVLEIGGGTGGLTAMVAEKAAAVVSVEMDQNLAQLASETLHGFDNVTLLVADALKNKNRLNPVVLETVEQKLAEVPESRFKLVANLPYNIATPVISNLLAIESPPVLMAVTIQKELADRILARPSTKDYGALSVWVQSQCRVELVRTLPPEAFWPRPKVWSAILRIVLDPEARARIPDLAYFHGFVRSMFFHRRKYLRSVVRSAYKGRLDTAAVDEALAEMKLGPESRAEQLDVETMLRLCETLRAKEQLGSTPS